ncbi:MAG TPA: cytidine deaminase, partial [Kofleriaceae bacterium]|nr:cytidine deaminase [Kofleriaceae bacterium]
ISAASRTLAKPALDRLARLMTASGFAGVIPAAEVQQLLAETGLTLPQLMLALCPFAALYSVAPISNFHVGAISCGASGNLYYGANMEFPDQPLSFCTHAEQSATVNAWMNGETGLGSIAVNQAPCGYCRQFLYETVSAATLEVILSNGTVPLTTLLPAAFGPQDLGVQGALLTPYTHGLSLVEPNPDPGIAAALAAANSAYAPYTSSYAGVALVTAGGIYAAPLAENAAYNPSMSPLEAALSQLNLSGNPYGSITQVALVEVEGAEVSQLDVTEAVASTVTDAPMIVGYAAAPATRPERARRP